MSDPKLTVFMPMYNSARYVAETIDSVLKQTFTDFEFLIIDDGSTDDSVAVVSQYTDPRIRLERNPQNLKLAKTRNRGLELARGEYIAFIDSDDICQPERLALQVAYLDTHPEIGVCGTWFTTFGECKPETVRVPADPQRIKTELWFDSMIPNTTAMIRKSWFKDLRYDETLLYYAEDYDLWLRASCTMHLGNIPRSLVLVRMHQASIRGQEKERRRKEALRYVLNRYLDLRGVPRYAGDIDLYYAIHTFAFEPDLKVLKNIEVWLLHVLEWNKTAAAFDQQLLQRLFAVRWAECCLHATSLGSCVWQLYFKTSLRRYCSIVLTLRILVKALLRK